MIRRCGLVAEKLGMTQIFNEAGKLLPVTLLRVPRNVIIGIKTFGKDGYNAVVIGYGESAVKKINKPLLGIANKAKVAPIKAVKEFRVSYDYSASIGKELSLKHFVLGQYIDVIGKSVGKGFAGPMKRWNFKGLEASHGVSISHRAHGSTGQRQDPGKVFKGKKMAGHMGCQTVTAQNLKVVDIDAKLNILAVLGCVPGSKGKIVVLRDAVKKSLPALVQIPAAFAE